MSGNSEEITILSSPNGIFVILRTVRGLMVSAGRSSGDVAHARSREEEIWAIRGTHQI